MTKENKKLIPGIVKRHADGFGFLIPDDTTHPDAYIPKHFMTGVMTNDRVLIEVFKSGGDDRYHGELIRIMSRGTKKVVGRLTQDNNKNYILIDESKGWGGSLLILNISSFPAKIGDLVQVEIKEYPSKDTQLTGNIIEVIGNSEDPLNDIKRVLRGQNVPEEFSKLTLTQVSPLKEDPEPSDWKSRVNLMDLPLITIDGATAKDFDDAVFCEINEKGFHLIVAIADVSYYVKPNTPLDKDAYDRGTSVYFPNFVVPMLPEILSNGLCSLKPQVPRLCLVADMQFDFQGARTHSKFYEAVMKSQARVTYGEAQEILDGSPIEKFNHVTENIQKCSDLAKILMARRFREGSLDLNIPQTELEIDAAGNPVDVQKSSRLFAHRLIEELMLAANVATSEFLESKENGSIFRIHEEPSADSIKTLETYLHNLGSKTRLAGGKLQKKLSKALEQFENHVEGPIINILTLRSLSQAKYSSNNIGHFGLGFASYTHFTSPIRRYPDLIVHRLIKHYVVSQTAYPIPDLETLTNSANILSSTEQRAVKCERQLVSIKKARFLSRQIGKEFVGMITSIARFGVFVVLREFDVDGLVKIENLGDDRWIYDEANLKFVGDKTKAVFKLGQIVKIIVTSVDIELGQINFDLHAESKVVNKSKKSFSKENSKDLKTKSFSNEKSTASKSFSKDNFSESKSSSHKSKKSQFSTKENLPPTKSTERVEQRKGPGRRLLDVLARFGKKPKDSVTTETKGTEEDSSNENHRNRKNDRKNFKKRRKIKDNTRSIRKTRPT